MPSIPVSHMDTVAVIGSRGFSDLAAVRNFVFNLPKNVVLVSGGALGVDQAAENAARAVRLSRWIFEPAVDSRVSSDVYIQALFDRNVRIVEHADRVVAFHDGVSKGTRRAIDYAIKLGIPCEIRSPR